MKTKNLNFGEALELMKAGRRVRMASWERNGYIHLKGGELLCNHGEQYALLNSALLATNWEVLPNYLNPTAPAVWGALLAGGKIAKTYWATGVFVQLKPDQSCLVDHRGELYQIQSFKDWVEL